MTDSNPITVTPKRHDPDTLFLREGWASGTGPDGETVELERTLGGGQIILCIEYADGVKVIETINVVTLTQAWAAAIAANRPAAEPAS